MTWRCWSKTLLFHLEEPWVCSPVWYEQMCLLIDWNHDLCKDKTQECKSFLIHYKSKLRNVNHFWFIISPVLPDVTLMTIQPESYNKWIVCPCPYLEILHKQHALPYFPVDNAHPLFSVLTNFFNRYRAPYVHRAPENTWNRTTGFGHARI
jgi:hypothetical protein